MTALYHPRRIAALSGLTGFACLVAYFAAPAFLSWPFAGDSPAHLEAYATAHQALFYAGAWLQGTGTLLCVIFFVALLKEANATGRLPGLVALLGAGSLLAVVLVEGAFMVAVPVAAASGDLATVATTFALSNGVFLRVFPLAPASATYIALGLVISSSPVIDSRYGYAAIGLGVAFELAGAAAILVPAVLVVLAVLAAAQSLWILAASVALWRSAS